MKFSNYSKTLCTSYSENDDGDIGEKGVLPWVLRHLMVGVLLEMNTRTPSTLLWLYVAAMEKPVTLCELERY